jgi:hypothetical protein
MYIDTNEVLCNRTGNPTMANVTRRIILSGILTGFAGKVYSAPTSSACPGVDPVTGLRPALYPPAIEPTLAPAREIPTPWVDGAMDIIALFEAGSRDRDAAYGNVSTTDVISLGYLQWNYNVGSLFTALLGQSSEQMIDAAPVAIRSEVARLANIGDHNKREALGIIQEWKTTGGSFRATKRAQLQEWLRSGPMRERQDQLVARRLKSALRRSDAWQVALDQEIEGKAAQRAFYTFVDIEVFNGDLNGLWVPHIREFRSQFSSPLEMMDFISSWVDDCVKYRFGGKAQHNGKAYSPAFKKLYRRKETPLSMADWRRLVAQNDPRVDESALNLIALGYLRALRSNGKDFPNGFGGVFELDVLNRRGMMATGRGVLPGSDVVTELFVL